MKKFLPLMVFACLITFSCQKEIELEQPAYQKRIVVDGYIETGQPAHIFLTLSSPFLTQYDSASIRASLDIGSLPLAHQSTENYIYLSG